MNLLSSGINHPVSIPCDFRYLLHLFRDFARGMRVTVFRSDAGTTAAA